VSDAPQRRPGESRDARFSAPKLDNWRYGDLLRYPNQVARWVPAFAGTTDLNGLDESTPAHPTIAGERGAGLAQSIYLAATQLPQTQG
jgi:hypothetical protein